MKHGDFCSISCSHAPSQLGLTVGSGSTALEEVESLNIAPGLLEFSELVNTGLIVRYFCTPVVCDQSRHLLNVCQSDDDSDDISSVCQETE